MKAIANQRGGISLEAAILLPVILMLAGAMVILLQSIGAEIKLKGALDRTASEISLLSPLCEMLNQTELNLTEPAPEMSSFQGNGSVKDLQNVLLEFWPKDKMKTFLTDAVLDLSSTVLLGSLMQSRLNYWLDEAWAGQPGWRHRLGQRQLYLDWQMEKQQLWLCLNYHLSTPLGNYHRQTQVVVPLWIGTGDLPATEGKVWLMDNFSRGKYLRQLYGSNLPEDFPVIARLNSGEATAIKSMDLTAPSYQSAEPIQTRIGLQINQLAAFQGANSKRGDQEINVSAADITSRRLLLIIPDNCRQAWLPDLLANLQKNADCQGVILEIKRHGSSERYLSTED